MQDALAMRFTFATTVTPTPSPTPTFDPDTITPGPEGFLVIAVLAIAVILLIADMMRRIRRGRVRADVTEQLDAEQARVDAERDARAPGTRSPSESDQPDDATGDDDAPRS